MGKKGQITVFIIIGLIILFVIGTVLYVSRTQVTKEFEKVRPQVAELPQQAQPLRDLVNTCIERLGADGLRRAGDSGGYVYTDTLFHNPQSPTDANAVQLSPGADPTIAYWWYMSSNNNCEQNCIFDSERPPLYLSEGSNSIESQLGIYVTENLRDCLGNFETFTKTGCDVQERGNPEVTANVAENDVFFVGNYPLRAVCGTQTFDVEDYYVTIPVAFKQIYELGTDLANMESQNRILERATKTVLFTFSSVDENALPPPQAYDVGPPSPGVYWIKFQVLEQIKTLLAAYIPLLQVAGVRNYEYIAAPTNVVDEEQFELTYNRQFFIPVNNTYPDIEARFTYLDWWEPYFDLNCNGQVCQPDSGTNFFMIPLSAHKYNFAYDLSYPVLVELRDPYAFNNQGYSFKFFLEQNMRNSEEFIGDLPTLDLPGRDRPARIFCNPDQQTSGTINLYVKDGMNLKGMDGATVSYICGTNNCNLGETDNGEFSSQFPRCIGGTLRVYKPGYASYAQPLDTNREEPQELQITLEPIRTLKATIKNYAVTKSSKYGNWRFLGGAPLRPPPSQSATIQLIRKGNDYEQQFGSFIELVGDEQGEINIVPGDYEIRISSFLKENLTIPSDYRCESYRKLGRKKKKCYWVPQDPILFNETKPLPYGGATYTYSISASKLRAADRIEFRQFVLGINRLSESQRIVEDLGQVGKVNMYSTAHINKVYPVIS